MKYAVSSQPANREFTASITRKPLFVSRHRNVAVTIATPAQLIKSQYTRGVTLYPKTLTPLCESKGDRRSFTATPTKLTKSTYPVAVRPFMILKIRSPGSIASITRRINYFRRAPTSTSSWKPVRTGRPSGPTEAATIMPLDSTPRSLRGARFTTTATLRPMRDSGS